MANVSSSNRFGEFFRELRKQTKIQGDSGSGGELYYYQHLKKMNRLLEEASECSEEMFQKSWEKFFVIGHDAEFLITEVMPRDQALDFYKFMASDATGLSPKQRGIMMSSYGQLLGFSKNRIEEAREQYRLARDLIEKHGDSRDLAWLYTHFGHVEFEQGEHPRAKGFYDDAIEILQRLRKDLKTPKGRDDQQLAYDRFMTERTLASVFSALGMMYDNTGDKKQAIEAHEKALDIRKKIFGQHITIGQAYNNLSIAYEKVGNRTKALEYARKGLHIKRALIKEPSNTVINSLLTVARMENQYEGNSDEALQHFDEACKLRQKLGLDHITTATIHHYRGNVYLSLERYSDAAESFSAMVAVYQDLSADPRKTARSLRLWGTALKNDGDYEEAKEKLTQSLEIIEKN